MPEANKPLLNYDKQKLFNILVTAVMAALAVLFGMDKTDPAPVNPPVVDATPAPKPSPTGTSTPAPPLKPVPDAISRSAAKPKPKTVDPIAIELIGPTEPVAAKEGFQVFYKVTPPEARATWKNVYPDGSAKPMLATDEDGNKSLGFFRAAKGEYRFRLFAQVSLDKKDGYDPFEVAELVVPVGGTEPTPNPQPNPDVDPQPDSDDTAIVKEAGFRALLLYEASDDGAPIVFSDKSIRDYLNSKCVRGSDGKTPSWRCWDDDLDPAGDDATMLAYRKASNPVSLPWVHCGNGKSAYNGPAPSTASELLSLLRKYGG